MFSEQKPKGAKNGGVFRKPCRACILLVCRDHLWPKLVGPPTTLFFASEDFSINFKGSHHPPWGGAPVPPVILRNAIPSKKLSFLHQKRVFTWWGALWTPPDRRKCKRTEESKDIGQGEKARGCPHPLFDQREKQETAEISFSPSLVSSLSTQKQGLAETRIPPEESGREGPRKYISVGGTKASARKERQGVSSGAFSLKSIRISTTEEKKWESG